MLSEIEYVKMVHQAISVHNQEWIGELMQAGIQLEKQIQGCHNTLFWNTVYSGRIQIETMRNLVVRDAA